MSDLKPSDGYKTIEEEFEARTAKPFREGADFISVHSRRQQFQIEAAIHCQTQAGSTGGFHANRNLELLYR